MKKTLTLAVLFLVLVLTGCNLSDITIPYFRPASSQPSEPELTEEERAAIRREEQLLPMLADAQRLALGYYYEEAMELLGTVPEEFAEDAEVTELIRTYADALNSFTPYEEPVRHIFFHSLIVDTSLAFDGDSMSNGYNYWMTTIDEFKRMLEELYKNNFVLIDIHELAREEMDAEGNVSFVANHPMMPAGKKPLVLSIDDVNYYEYMEKDGFARKLLLDENGAVKNLYIDKDGNELIGDYDVVPIVDTFVKEHPDFSFRGSKGIIALTGYEGTLGYDTHLKESLTYEQDKLDAAATAKRLRETGWQFAVHGWGHRHTQKISYDSLVEDTARWKNEVGTLVGNTDIYIYPYGEEVDYPSEKLTHLQSEGYRYFCGVWSKAFVSVKDTYVRQSRANLDGFSMITRPNSMADLFDVPKVLDQTRPELK